MICLIQGCIFSLKLISSSWKIPFFPKARYVCAKRKSKLFVIFSYFMFLIMYPCIHTWGIRTKKSSHFTRPKTLVEGWLYRMGQWRETKHKDMLHLEDNACIRMGKTMRRIFQRNIQNHRISGQVKE